ncbi:MAG: HAMP domain-containing sensor histidine kinase [Cucumibacter sp.]
MARGLEPMDPDWTRGGSAAQVLALTLDQRPAWLWSGDGKTLLWRNVAGVLFRGKSKKHKARLAPLPVPIKGQVPRLIKLGTPGRPSLSRLRFLADKKPVSATCLCTPIKFDGELHLLIVDTEALEAAMLAGLGRGKALEENLFGDGRAYEIAGADGAIVARQGEAGEGKARREFAIGTSGAKLVLIETAEAERPVAAATIEVAAPMQRRQAASGLTGLVDRLALAGALYTSLDETDDLPLAPALPAAPGSRLAPEGADRYLFALGAGGEYFAGRAAASPGLSSQGKAAGFSGMAPFALPLRGEGGTPVTAIPIFNRFGGTAGWRAYGRPEAPQDETPPPPETADTDDRQSRYNFAELSRILNDRISGEEAGPSPLPSTLPAPRGDLVALSDETLVLNRLPLGLLVFREQAILFANRAMADLVGFGASSAVREAGLEAIFPDAAGEGAAIGPVTRVRGRDGKFVPVIARLQTISWQGRPAYLLSARAADAAASHVAVNAMTTRATVELIAAQSDCGFIQLTRTGNIDGISDRGAAILGPARNVLLSRPLLAYLDPASKARFAGFLAHAGEAGDEAITVKADAGAGLADVTIFADRRRDGRVEGFLGLVRSAPAAARATAPAVSDAELGTVLAQLSRELRAPLNTILGFSELMIGEGGDELAAARIKEYARDIHKAGRQIGLLVDELTDLSRLEGGRFELTETEIDLGILLESCVAQIRPQANSRQIVLRSAVSPSLPRIVADRSVLTQTVMNLLASAIALSGRGGNVVLSAKLEDKGGIGVHVRDHGGQRAGAAGEGFVVYRAPAGGADDEEPLRSGTGLALTRSLARANALSLSFDEQAGAGTLMALEIPAGKIVRH